MKLKASTRTGFQWVLGGCSMLLLACSSDPPAGTQSPGGGAGSGGTSAAAGNAGSGATGGNTGGTGTGGLSGGAGVGGTSTGGTSTGGTNTGGTSTGGTSTGGTNTGGTNTGGAGLGGADTGGAGGMSGTAGTSGAGGTGGATTSTGCGSTTPVQGGNKTIDVDGVQRDYVLALPDNYDSNRPYALIFGWHWRYGSAQDVVQNSYYGLRPRANGTAIFVAPDGIDDGWANTNGRDIAFTEAMLARFKAELCIDESRIFSTGFSYGGMMSFAVACALGDVFRAIAPMAGALYSGCEDGTAPVAMWGAHGYSGGDPPDGVVNLDHGRQGRDVFLERNGCSATTTPVAPDECVAYQGCRDGYPVTWCEWDGGHVIPPFASQAIWEFFSQF